MKNIEKLINDIDITVEAPITEPERQYYFIKKARDFLNFVEINIAKEPSLSRRLSFITQYDSNRFRKSS